MKIKDIFEIETIDDKQYMICLDSNVLAGMVELNETAAYIVECMKSETTIEEIAKKSQTSMKSRRRRQFLA